MSGDRRISVTRCEIEGCDMEDAVSNGIVVLQVCTRCGGQSLRAVG